MISPTKSVSGNFENVKSTAPLSDVRRTRTKSTGRPPSQHFIKENALQRCISLEWDETDPKEIESKTITTTESSSSSRVMVNEVLETLLKKKEETVVSTEVKKTSLEIPPKVPPKGDIPWMKEFLNKRRHKRSSVREDDKKIVEDLTHEGLLPETVLSSSFEMKRSVIVNRTEQEKHDNDNIEKHVEVSKVNEDFVVNNGIVVVDNKTASHEKYDVAPEKQRRRQSKSSESSSVPTSPKIANGGSQPEKTTELPKADSTQDIPNKTDLNLEGSPPELPETLNLDGDIEDKTDGAIEDIGKPEIENLLLKIKNFEETCNRRLKNIRNDLKILHRELASQSEYVSEFVKTVENDLTVIRNHK